MGNNSRNTILQRIREGIQQKTPLPYPNLDSIPMTNQEVAPDIETFAINFTNNEGRFIYCENSEDFHKKLKEVAKKVGWKYVYCWHKTLVSFLQQKDFRNCKIGHRLDKAHAGLTPCESLIMDTGSILYSSALQSGRSLAILPPVWLVIASSQHVVTSLSQAFKNLQTKYPDGFPSMLNLVSGHAYTQSIGMKKIKAGMGPQEIYLFYVEDMEWDL